MLEQEKNNKGFSLLEIIVVLAIVGALAGVGIPNFTKWNNGRAVSNATEQVASLLRNIHATTERGTFAYVQVLFESDDNDGISIQTKGVTMDNFTYKMNDPNDIWNVSSDTRCSIMEIDPEKRRISLSYKAVLGNPWDKLVKESPVGSVVNAKVKNITDFGVFVDLGGLDGLLHITDLSWGRVNHPSEITSIGETINVKIIEIDSNKQRISLGLKQLVPHPWDNVEEKFPVASKIKGKVVSLTNYGAFVELDTGVEGLVHVSEMSWTRNIRRPDEVVQLGEEVEAQVLSIDLSERKIALGFKQLQNDPWQEVQDLSLIHI